MYRPQYFYETPPGFRDEPFVRPVTYGQDLSGSLPAGQFLQSYVVQMDGDAPQIIRGLFWQGRQQGQGTDEIGSVQVRLRDAFGIDLTDGFIPLWLLCWGAGVTPPDGGSGRAKVFEPELYCPPSSVLLIDYFDPDGAAYAYPGLMEFRGVKRFPEGCTI